MSQSSPFLSNDANQVRWTSGHLYKTDTRFSPVQDKIPKPSTIDEYRTFIADEIGS